MKAIIVAAGRGTRMRELTEHTPKPLLKAGDKNLIEHKLDILPSEIDEVIIVIGYHGDKIRNYFGTSYKSKKISYIEEPTLQGTGYAVHASRRHLEGNRFLYMMGDDIYHKDDVAEMLKYPWAMSVVEKEGTGIGGRVYLDESGMVGKIVEGTHTDRQVLLNIGLFIADKEFFNYDLVKLPGRNEYGFPQQFAQAAKDFPIKVIISKGWKAISSPEDLTEPGFSL